jgi:methionyl-tRNA formyltransferase
MNVNKITILVDNDSWILPYAEQLVQKLIGLNYETKLIRNIEAMELGWINFILGCTHLIQSDKLNLNQHNLVVHESDLPKGRGFAPMTWQILEGENKIPICLIDAADEADAGHIWLQDSIELKGGEICDEWRQLQGEKTIELCLRFVTEYASMSKVAQSGLPSYFSRRGPIDSRLDPNKTLSELFNTLRVCDNNRYPAFFEINNRRYILKIYADESSGNAE